MAHSYSYGSTHDLTCMPCAALATTQLLDTISSHYIFRERPCQRTPPRLSGWVSGEVQNTETSSLLPKLHGFQLSNTAHLGRLS